MEAIGELEIRFDICELMKNKPLDMNNLVNRIAEIGKLEGEILSFDWNGYTHTLTVGGFPQRYVPDVRDWLDSEGFTETDVQFTGVM